MATVDVESLVVDFSSFDDKDKANVRKAIEDKEVMIVPFKFNAMDLYLTILPHLLPLD